MKNTINCVVKLEDGKPIIFWYEIFRRGNLEFSVLGCYTVADSHNNSSKEYMQSLPTADDDVAQKFISRYNFNYCDDNEPEFKLVKRLVKPKDKVIK